MLIYKNSLFWKSRIFFNSLFFLLFSSICPMHMVLSYLGIYPTSIQYTLSVFHHTQYPSLLPPHASHEIFP